MLARHAPALLRRARVLLGLPGGPADELSAREVALAARAVEALHEGLVGDRELAQASTYRARHLGAYLLWWWPQTYAKTQAALQLAPMPRRPRIVDLGSGPGPAAIAALDLLGGEALAVDASEPALAEARALDPALKTRVHDLAQGVPDGEFDVAIAANVLSELPRPEVVERVQAKTLVLIEPALRETGRALLTLRDAWLKRGWFAVAPCLTQKPCPALSSAKDWCTAERRWEPPRFVVQLAEATGLRADELLSFAPLVLSREAPQQAAGVWRVVGVPPPEKGKKRLFVCSDEGRLALVRLDREASQENAQFEQLERGDLVQLGGLARRGDGLRVTRADAVRKL